MNIELPTSNIEHRSGKGRRREQRTEDREEFNAKVANGERVVILNFKFWILNWEEVEEFAFCCDPLSTIRYLCFFCCRRTWNRMPQGRTGTRCPSYGEEVIGQWSPVIGKAMRSGFFVFCPLSSVFSENCPLET